jgi:hypothetical protein
VLPLALSYRAADRLMGARHGTTAALVAAGRLRAVPWGSRVRVLRDDLERVAAEGLTTDLRRPKAPRRKPTTTGVGAAIMAIDLDALRSD